MCIYVCMCVASELLLIGFLPKWGGIERSIYSWDLVNTKINGKIIIDKRDGSQVASPPPPGTDNQ